MGKNEFEPTGALRLTAKKL